MGVLKSIVLLAAPLLVAIGASRTANSESLCEGFLPPNELRIPVGDRTHAGILGGAGLTQEQFDSVLNRLQSLYADIVKQKGGTLVINHLWSDSTVNANAGRQGKNWIINMYGGLARHPDMTYEGQALVACHELGHHIGGAPKAGSVFGSAWATNEGGADYYATLKCLRVFFAQDDNASIIAHATIDPLARSQCNAQFSAKADQDVCMRISLSSESVSYIFQDLTHSQTRPMFSTPDKTEVAKTNDDHPATQCRMDTYFGGSLCAVALSVPNSDTDFKAGACVQGVDQVGFRSRCWFNPVSSNPAPGPGPGPGQPGSCPLGDDSLCQQLCQLQPTLPFCKQ